MGSLIVENQEINSKQVCDILNAIMEYELAGVVRYTHSSMMVSGPYRPVSYTHLTLPTKRIV